jgi:hypothetical protein
VEIFADTYYFLALVGPESKERERALDATAKFNGIIVVTEWVLVEVANSLSDPRHRGTFIAIYSALRGNSKVSIIESAPLLFSNSIDLYTQRPDKAWSLTDCLSFVVMKQRGITDALTADHHFEQAGFRAVLKAD